MVYTGAYANEKAEIVALKKEYKQQHGKNPLGPKSNDLNWLRAKTAGKDGAPGKDGRHGRPGKAGKDGRPGKAGKDGRPGKAGKDAKDVNINNTINNHYYAASTESSGSDSDSGNDSPAAGGAAAGGAAGPLDLYSFASRGGKSEIKTLNYKFEHGMVIPAVKTLVATAISHILKAAAMRTPLATAAKKTVAAEKAWMAARDILVIAEAAIVTLKTSDLEKSIYYQRTGLNLDHLTKGQHAKLRREQAELQQKLGQEYIDAGKRVEADIRAVETAELEKAASYLVYKAAKDSEKTLLDQYKKCQTTAEQCQVDADAIVEVERCKEEDKGPDGPTLGWETDSQVFDDAPVEDEPPSAPPSAPPPYNPAAGGGGYTADQYYQMGRSTPPPYGSDHFQNLAPYPPGHFQNQPAAATYPPPPPPPAAATYPPAAARGGGWGQPRGWDAQPPIQQHWTAPPSNSSAASFMSAAAAAPAHPRMIPSNAEDYRRDERDAAGAGPAAKRTRATRHDAAAKSSSAHGGMERFLEKK